MRVVISPMIQLHSSSNAVHLLDSLHTQSHTRAADNTSHNTILKPAQESDNFYHYMDNRVLPPHVDEELAKAEGEGGLTRCRSDWRLTAFDRL